MGLFGFSIEDNQRLSKSALSPVPPNSEDGVDYFLSSGFFGQYIDIEGVYKTEFDLIKRYREMSLHPECDNAIEDVVNEAIVSDSNDHPIDINLDNLNGDTLKKVIEQEFKYVLDLLILIKSVMRFSATGMLTEESSIIKSSILRDHKMVFKRSTY